MHYLARWRLQLAANLLANKGTSLALAAAQVGYESEAAFNRAFKKFVGLPPGAWRKSRVVGAESRAVARSGVNRRTSYPAFRNS